MLMAPVQCVLNTLQHTSPLSSNIRRLKQSSVFHFCFSSYVLHSRDNHAHVRNPISYLPSTLVCFELVHYYSERTMYGTCVCVNIFQNQENIS